MAMKVKQSRAVHRGIDFDSRTVDLEVEVGSVPVRFRRHEDSGVRLSESRERVVDLPPMYVES